MLKRLWNAWRGVLDREEERWRSEVSGTRGDSPERENGPDCGVPAPPPTVTDLVKQRQAELRKD